MLNKTLMVLFNLLFFAVPLLMVPFTSELFEFNKLIFIYLITLGVAFIWLFKIVLDRKIIIKKTPFNIPILLFLITQILATIFSIDPHTSMYGYYGRFNGGLLSIIAYITLYFAFISNFDYRLYYYKLIFLLKTSLLASAAVMVWGLSGKLGIDFSCLLFVGQIGNNCWTDQFRPAERMFSTLGQPNWLGAYLTINFFISAYFLLANILTSKKINLKFILITSYLFLNFSSILFTRSRSALFAATVGLVLLTICLFILLKERMIKSLQKLLILSLLLPVFSVLLFKTGVEKIDKFLSPSTYHKVINFTSSVEQPDSGQAESGQTSAASFESDVTASSDIRRIVWRGAVELGLKYPLLGTGVETFAYSYYFTRPQEHNLTSEWDFLYNKAHNEYLNYFATTGFIGLFAYLILIASVLVYGWRNVKYSHFAKASRDKQKLISENQDNEAMNQWNNILTVCLLIAYITILITNFFGFSTTTINLFFYLIPAFIALLTQKSETLQEKQSFQTSKFWQNFSLLFLITVTVTLLFGLVRYYLADIKYAKADNYSKLGDFQNAAQLMTEANNLKQEHVYEDKLSNILANIAFTASYQKENRIANNLIKASDELNNKTLKASPQNVLYWKTRAKNYYLYYQVSLNEKDLWEAIQSLEKAGQLYPTDPKIPYSLAIFYSLLSDSEKNNTEKSRSENMSLQEIDRSIKLKNNYRDAFYLKGQLLKKIGKIAEARQSFEFILKNINPNDSEVKKELESL